MKSNVPIAPMAFAALALACHPGAIGQTLSPTTATGTVAAGSTTVSAFDLVPALHAKTLWKAVVYSDLQDGFTFEPSESRICFDDGAPAPPPCAYFAALFGRHEGDKHFVDLSIVHVAPGVPAVKLEAAANYVDGSASQTAIWVYRAASNGFALALTANLGNESNGHLLQEGALDADFIEAQKCGGGDKTRWDAQNYCIVVER